MPGHSPKIDRCAGCLAAAWDHMESVGVCTTDIADLLLAWASQVPLQPMATAEQKGSREHSSLGPKRHEGRDLWQNWASAVPAFLSNFFLWCCPGNLPVSALQMVGS